MYCGDVHYVWRVSSTERRGGWAKERKVTPVLVFLPHYLLEEERGGMKNVSSGPEAISFFLSPFFSFQGRNATDFGKNGEVEEFMWNFEATKLRRILFLGKGILGI